VAAIGEPLKRLGDPRLLRGHGRYVADIRLNDMLHAAFVRSIYAHANIVDVDVSKARALPGIVAIWTPYDVSFAALPLLFAHPKLDPVTQIPLGRTVHHVGEPICLVLATSRYRAEDAVALIDVKYQPLPAVVRLQDALREDAPSAHADRSSNIAAQFEQIIGDARAALASAPVVVRDAFTIGRISCMPMETRGLVAQWQNQQTEETLTVYGATQTPHMMRRVYSEYFGVGEERIRVVAPDVGGAFGAKEPFYAEDLLVAWGAREVGRPVSWIEDRMEHLQASVHEREQQHKSAMGLTRDGHIIAVQDDFIASTGAYVPWGVIVPIITSTLIPGAFRVPNYLCRATVAYTNTTPLAPYRGAGRPQAAMVINRLLDLAADVLQMDPAEIRMRNFIPTDAFPYDTGLISREGSPMVLDSGNYPELWKQLLKTGDYDGWRRRQKESSSQDRHIGIGLAIALENTGMGPFEGATVEIEENGAVTVSTGAASQGQGHETSLAQIAADVLGVAVDRVRVREGDTQLLRLGTGTFASRTAAVAGSAVHDSAVAIKAKVFAMAEVLLEAHQDDLEMQAGCVQVRGVPSKSLSLGSLAYLASGPFPGSTFAFAIEPGLRATRYFVPQGAVYSASAHLVVVEVERSTATVRILHYVSAHDCGTEVNPLIVTGQIMGGIVAGIGTALYEEVVYDESGQLLTNTLMDYLLPGAAEMPDILSVSCPIPTPLNPLGVKGVGESGAIPAPAAISAAVQDAIRDWGGRVSRIPIRASDLRAELIQNIG
jgi:carbon-monoxide dehydrogenase large subunit